MRAYRDWSCPECGHEVTAKDKPEPIRWSDGHTCRFVEGFDNTLARNAPPVLGGFTEPTRRVDLVAILKRTLPKPRKEPNQ